MIDGRGNRLLGWLMLTLAFVVSAGLDPWSLSHRDPATLADSKAMLARHAQAVVIGMAFLQLLLGILLSHLEPTPKRTPLVAFLSATGAIAYSLGYGLFVVWPSGAWLAVVGASCNVVALALLLPARFSSAMGAIPRTAVVVLCFGLTLDALMALAAAAPDLFRPEWLGPDEGVRLRMLRLARAAMIALPLLSLLYAEARARARPLPRLLEWAGSVLAFGAATMPLLLVLSACVWMDFKYLLGLPANAAVAGILAGAYLSYRGGSRLALAGWLFVLLSTNAGLFMGLYAFDGPVPDPSFLGGYNDFARRLSRLGHAYVIIVGLMLLNLRRDLPADSFRIGAWLVAGGGAIALLGMVLLSLGWADEKTLGAGPTLIGLGLFASLPALLERGRSDSRNGGGA